MENNFLERTDKKLGIRVSGLSFPISGRILIVLVLLEAAFLFPALARGQYALRLGSNYNRALNITGAHETWTRDWSVTETAMVFPDGGNAGFYRRVLRMGHVTPHTGRRGVLYLYPESNYRPARISNTQVEVIWANSRLVIGVCANRIPDGEWLLRVLVDRQQLGDDFIIRGRNGWQDLAFDLSGFQGRRVDIHVEAFGVKRNVSHVYIDYIHLEDPAERPMLSPRVPAMGVVPFVPGPGEHDYFDQYYESFLNILMEREDRRDQNLFYRYGADRYPKKPCTSKKRQ